MLRIHGCSLLKQVKKENCKEELDNLGLLWKQLRVGPGAILLIPSLPHFLLYLLVFLLFHFSFLIHFSYFLAFRSRPILPE